MYNALSVAKYVIDRSNNTKNPISNLKLQKLLYFIQAEFLVSTGHPCFNDDIEAWPLGPVVPIVYEKYRIFGSTLIPFSYGNESYISVFDKLIIDNIIEICKDYSASYLVSLTHKQKPWLEAYNNGPYSKITNASIKSFFEN